MVSMDSLHSQLSTVSEDSGMGSCCASTPDLTSPYDHGNDGYPGNDCYGNEEEEEEVVAPSVSLLKNKFDSPSPKPSFVRVGFVRLAGN